MAETNNNNNPSGKFPPPGIPKYLRRRGRLATEVLSYSKNIDEEFILKVCS